MFLMFTNLLMNNQVGVRTPLKDILDSAKNITQYAMVDYHPAQRPQVYTKLGLFGSTQGTFRTYLHGNIGQIKTIGKEAKTNATPALLMAAVLFALSGAKGGPGIEEANDMIKAYAKISGDSIPSVTGLMLKHAPAWMTIGPFSDATGYDIHSKYAMNRIIPEHLKGAHIEMVWKPLMSAWELAHQKWKTGDTTRQNWVNFGRDVSPASIRDQYDTYLNIDHATGAFADRETKFSPARDILSQEELGKRKNVTGLVLGAKPLTESMRSMTDWENMQKNLSDKEAMVYLSEQFKKHMAEGSISEDTFARITQKYLERSGSVENTVAMVNRQIKSVTNNTLKIKILRGVDRGIMNAQKLRALDNKYREVQ
jgi:hypothetical protein